MQFYSPVRIARTHAKTERMVYFPGCQCRMLEQAAVTSIPGQ